MKIYQVKSLAKGKFWLLALLSLAISQILLACGSETVNSSVKITTALPTNQPTAFPTSSVTNVPPTPTLSSASLLTCKINSAYSYTPSPSLKLEGERQQCLRVLDENLKKWKARNVGNYEIMVSYQRGYFYPMENYNYTVKNAKIVQQNFGAIDTSHDPNRNPTPYTMTPTYGGGRELTIEGLFEAMRSQLEDGPWWEGAYFIANFDTDYGYPKSFVKDAIWQTDSAYIWKVVSIKFNP